MSHLNAQTYESIAKALKTWTGIDLGAGKQALVESRLHWRLQELGLEDLNAYLKFLERHPSERQAFINSLTTNKTDWFREAEHFEYLTKKIIPSLRSSGPLTIWSAASSSGEEIYTLAMCLAEHFGKNDGFRILGSDIDTECLDHAQEAVYRRETVEAQVPKYLRLKYFDFDQDKAKVRDELKKNLKFRPFNLVGSDWPVAVQFDVIFIRNVLIYFKAQTVEEVIHRICRYLRPDGYLVVGNSETLTMLKTPLQPVAGSIYKKAA
jgi:chemotaxis protein methyltransferase CheR